MMTKRNNCGSRRGGGPAPFLVKTHQMVEDNVTDDVISWGKTGTSFVVWKPVEFARDLLPVHFKHNNFSSFVRQLNTYGFHKVVPDRWEFANDNFRQGEQRLLCKIRRRKAALPQVPSAGKASADRNNRPPPSPLSNSGEAHSSSTASLLPPSEHLLELTHENEKLRMDNQILSTELAQAKRQYRELLASLSNFVDVSQPNLSVLMQEKSALSVGNGSETETKKKEAEEEKMDNEEEGLKLFGVLLKGLGGEGSDKSRRPKRGRCDESADGCSVGERPMKMGFGWPWWGMSSTVQHGSSRVCN
ncbi:heat stress transcription factor B-1-like [Musa acuminata AAA Group]|uniref:heat stress transcription factor B-1-like n=1 Tax=Musa acuminata AAA Group TaxID=214697 RepID=UPI0031D27918